MPNDGDVVDIRGGLIAGPLRAVTDPEETTEWEQVSPRHIDAADWRRFEEYVSEIFGAFGMDLDTPGTQETPQRFLKAMFDATSGYEGDEKLLTAFPNECDSEGAASTTRSSKAPSPSTRCASITRCRSTGSRTSATSRTSGSSASPS